MSKKQTTTKFKKKVTNSSQSWFKKPFGAIRARVQGLLARRPHRSFRLTRRRDYVRPLRLPGYWSFTGEVWKMLFKSKKLFLGLALFYAVLTVLLIGITSQETYKELSDALRQAEGESSNGLGEVGTAGLLLASIFTGALDGTSTDVQRIYGVLLGLLVWLAVIWLLRALIAGQRPRLRDGLYSSGAPIISTLLVAGVLAIQLLPIALALVGYGAASTSGLLNGGVEAMVFWVVAALLAILSIYWVTSSFFALAIVTLPGMYPMQALKTSGDLVVGRRVRLLLRLLWLGLVIALIWSLIMIPIILLDTWLKQAFSEIAWLPIVPVVLLLMTSLTIVWTSGYIYLLYRKVVDDDAAPA